MKRAGLTLLLLFILASCHVGRFFIYNFADIKDYRKFPKKDIQASAKPFVFVPYSGQPGVYIPATSRKGKRLTFEQTLQVSNTVAFLVLRNDSVLYEWYAKNYSASSIVPSFSMAKSFVSALIGIALDEGRIKNTGEPITNYLDFLNPATFGKITIQHLLDMQSGIHYNESYINPFGDVAKYYYGTNLKKYLKRLRVKEEPGKHFEYISLNTQLLGLILEKCYEKGLSELLKEKLWEPLGMEHNASWSVDSKKHGTEKAFCCINARCHDFARFGRLYLNNGNWNSRQVISEKWIEESVVFKENKNNFIYQNQWWHPRNFYSVEDTLKLSPPWSVIQNNKGKQFACKASGDYFAEGHLGQFIYVSPAKKLVMVRLGKNEGKLDWVGMFRQIRHMN